MKIQREREVAQNLVTEETFSLRSPAFELLPGYFETNQPILANLADILPI